MKILTAMMLVGAMVLGLLYSSGLNAEYKSLGLTRHSVIAMLTQEGLNPWLTDFPPYEGEPVTSATVNNPSLSIEMIGADDGLTEVTLTVSPSTDENDAYWYGYVSLWLLAAIFPNWDNREEWLNRAIAADEKIKFSRDGYDIGMVREGRLLFLVVSGQEID